MFNGYPTDGGGLREKFGLSEERFRYVTQLALKHRRNGTNFYWGMLGGLNSEEEELCYYLLAGVESSVNYNGQDISLAETPSNFVVRRYTPAGSADYQSLIVAEYLPTTETYPAYLSKRNADGEELAGAKIEVQKADGTVVDSWTSDGTIHSVKVAPGTYQMVEKAAPEGYELATSIEFTVGEDGTVTCGEATVTSDAPIVMVDQVKDTPKPSEPTFPISFSKQKEDSTGLAGATLELRAEDGTVVETWVSTEAMHVMDLKPGTYTIVETAAPENYLVADPITFILESRTDTTGNVYGVVKVNGEEWTISEKATNALVMVDQSRTQKYPVEFSKRDIAGAELPDATIEVQTSKGETLRTWISDGSAHTFYLEPGEYRFVETAAPDGYKLATTIVFEVGPDGTITVDGTTTEGPIVMVDAPDVPDTPDKPTPRSNQPEVPENPDTGDTMGWMVSFALMIGSLTAMLILLSKKRRITDR
jgi:hypothetical protein